MLLGPDQPFYGLRSQGLDGKRKPYETVEEMAAHYVREVRAFQPEGPYYLGGYSFGGKVAFEMARQLRTAGHVTALLAFLDTSSFPVAPGSSRMDIVRDRARAHLTALKTGGATQKATYLLGRFPALLSLARRVAAHAHERIFHPLKRAQRKVLEANHGAARLYVPGHYEGRATILRARDRWQDFPEETAERDSRLGWERLCGEGVDVYEVPGGHYTLMRDAACLRALAATLSECLNAAQTSRAVVPLSAASGS